MAGIDVRVTISAADEGAAAQLAALKKAAGELGVQFTATTTSASQLGTVQFGPIRTAMTGLIQQAGQLAAGYLSVYAAVQAIRDTVDIIEESQKAMALLTASIQVTGSAAGFTAGQIKAFSDQLAHRTLFNAEDIERAAAQLMAFRGISGDTFKNVLQDAINLNTLFGGDLTMAVRSLGRAFQDPVAGLGTLSRVGITFTEGVKEQIKAMVAAGDLMGAQALLQQELATRMPDAAAAAHGLAGELHLVSTAWRDLVTSFSDSTSIVGTAFGRMSEGLANLIDKIRSVLNPTQQESFTAAIHGAISYAESRLPGGGLGENLYAKSPQQLLTFFEQNRQQLQNPGGAASPLDPYEQIIKSLREAIPLQQQLTHEAVDQGQQQFLAITKGLQAARLAGQDVAQKARELADKAAAEAAIKAAAAANAAQVAGAEARIALIQRTAEKERTIEENRYKTGIDNVTEYHRRSSAIEVQALRDELAIRQQEIDAVADPKTLQGIGDAIIKIDQQIKTALESGATTLAVDTQNRVKEATEAIKVQFEAMRKSISEATETIHATLETHVTDIHTELAAGTITKPQAAAGLASAYQEALTDLVAARNQAELFAAVVGDDAANLAVHKLNLEIAQTTLEYEKAESASNEFAKAIGEALGKAFTEAFDDILGKAAKFGAELRKIAFDVVRDVQRSITGALSQNLQQAITRAIHPPPKPPVESQSGIFLPGLLPPEVQAILRASGGPQRPIGAESAAGPLITAAGHLDAAASHLEAVAPTRAPLTGGAVIAPSSTVPGVPTGESPSAPPPGSVPPIVGDIGGLAQSGAQAATSAPGSALGAVTQRAGGVLGFIQQAIPIIKSFLPGAGVPLPGGGPGGLSSLLGLDTLTDAADAGPGLASIITDMAPIAAAATGGPIRGPGTGTSDSVPAWLSHGEYVVNAQAVHRLGLPTLESINRGMLPRTAGHYATGGLITPHGDARGAESHVTIGLEEGLVLRHMESPAGQSVHMRVLNRNQRAAKQILGVG